MQQKEAVSMAIKTNCLKTKDRRVAITRTDIGVKDAIRMSLDQIGGLSQFVKPGERVFVKPNLTGDRPPLTGAVTNPEVLKGLIELLYEQNPKEVLLGDSPSWGFDAEKTYDITGVRKVAEETGCTLVNLDKGKKVKYSITDAGRLKETRLSKIVLDCDKLINVPVMKTHMQCMVSLGLKNMKGLLPLRWKAKVHDLEGKDDYSGLIVGVADLHRLIKPDLTVVDGTYAMEGRGPFDGDTVKMDLIIAGENEVLVDAVCTKLMGFDVEDVETIKLCAEVDSIRWDDYEIVGEEIDAVKRAFKPCPTEIDAGENVEVCLGVVCTGCLATLNTAIHRAFERGVLDNVEEFALAIGKDPVVPADTERVVYIGQCAIEEGKMLQTATQREIAKGCPPTGWDIVDAFKKFQKGGQ
jgi:uncharacterized protein (DUF362 family)